MTAVFPLPKFQYFLEHTRNHALNPDKGLTHRMKKTEIAPLDGNPLSSHVLIWEKPPSASGEGEETLFSWTPAEKTFRTIHSHRLHRCKWKFIPRFCSEKQRKKYLRQRDRCEIVRRVSAGEKQAHLAKEFGISRAAVCYLLKHQKEILQKSARL